MVGPARPSEGVQLKDRPLAGFAWIAAAAALGFAASGLFGGVLHLSRRIFLIPYTLLVASFTYAFVKANRLDIGRLLRRHWRRGLVGAVLLAVFSVGTVLAQPASARASGWQLGFDLLWSGVVYGTADAVLLSVIPMLAGWRAARSFGWTTGRHGRAIGRAVGVGASVIVVAAYHLGFPEYRGPEIVGAVFGNGLLTLGYAITGSPLAPVLSHVVMHVAALLRGPATMSQLPPHI
jgi:hypothetical protein